MTNTKKNVIVVSARRSGTHLLVDLIVNNFGYESINYNYIDYYEYTDEMPKFTGAMNKGNQVTWTHLHDYKNYYKRPHSKEDLDTLDKYFSESKIILVFRDIRDVINSCFLRPKYKEKYKTFENFYNTFDYDGYELIDEEYDNFFELLLRYYKNWFSVYMSKEILDLDIELVYFNEVIHEYESTVNRIGKFLDKPVDKLVDIRFKKNKDVIYTSNDFRSGKVGEWTKTIQPWLGHELGKRFEVDLGAGIDCFTNDVKIHEYHTPERTKYESKDTNWKEIELTAEDKLKQFKNKFKFFGEKDIAELIEGRYKQAIKQSSDFRYFHKVFYFDKYVLKFIYPCKATLSRDAFHRATPAASKEILSTILQTDDILFDLGIVPKLYHAGLYKGVLYAVQEKIPEEDIIWKKYNVHPAWGDWKPYVRENTLYPIILKHFMNALDNNIVLTDIVSAYNTSFSDDGKVKYFDLDGIKYFDTRKEMTESIDFKNALGIIKEVDRHYTEKYNQSLIKGFDRYL